MYIPRRICSISLTFAAGAISLLLTLSLHSQPTAHAKAVPADKDAVQTAETPEQVADTLDSIVQPRFQQNAGRFGVDRVVFLGHDDIYDFAGTMTASEQRRFHQVKAAHRPYVIAFLHCAHKPGHDLLDKAHDLQEASIPSLQTLTAGTATDDGSAKLYDWGNTHLKQAVLPNLPVLRRGIGMDKDLGNWRLVLRPVRASRASCLGCHVGARRDDTLGVMVYAVDKAVIHAPIRSFYGADM